MVYIKSGTQSVRLRDGGVRKCRTLAHFQVLTSYFTITYRKKRECQPPLGDLALSLFAMASHFETWRGSEETMMIGLPPLAFALLP
jgi:hypothetical protein